MTIASDADRLAAARLLGLPTSALPKPGTGSEFAEGERATPAPRMYDPAGGLLQGAALCGHDLTGSGHPVYCEHIGKTVSDEWARHPYRHHIFTPGSLSGGHIYCVCGNSEKHQVHAACWAGYPWRHDQP